MTTYSDWQQRQMDIESGKEMDRRASTSIHTVRCKRTGEGIGIKQDGGSCVCTSADECRLHPAEPRRSDPLREAIAALTDIAQGNVPPGFTNGIELESRAAFQERLASWMQNRAHAALAALNPPAPAQERTGNVEVEKHST